MDSKPDIIEEQPIAMHELKAEISKIAKRDGELNFRVQKTEEYLNLFVTMSQKKYKELVAELEGLDIPRLKPEHIIKIVDVLPTDVESLKLTLQGFTVSVSQDNMKKIVKVVESYVK